MVLQRRSPRPLVIKSRSNNDLGDLRRSNTAQLAISPVRSYKNRRRPTALISFFYLAVIDEKLWQYIMNLIKDAAAIQVIINLINEAIVIQ